MGETMIGGMPLGKNGVEEKRVREWHYILGCSLALRMKLGLFHNKGLRMNIGHHK